MRSWRLWWLRVVCWDRRRYPNPVCGQFFCRRWWWGHRAHWYVGLPRWILGRPSLWAVRWAINLGPIDWWAEERRTHRRWWSNGCRLWLCAVFWARHQGLITRQAWWWRHRQLWWWHEAGRWIVGVWWWRCHLGSSSTVFWPSFVCGLK